jgi:hypothetical protein
MKEVPMSARSLPRTTLPAVLVLHLAVAVAAASCGSGKSSGGSGAASGSGAANGAGGTTGSGAGGHVSSDYPCSGCPSFPPSGAPVCSPGVLGAPTIAYPLDGLLLPPNMNVLEVQFVPPAGATLFEVDFENAITDVKVETQCNPVMPVRGGPSPGCGVTLPQAAWNDIANHNREGDPVKVTVRATVNGSCVSTSTANVSISFAKDDIIGGIYYWQSATYGGIGGKTGGIYSHDFGTFDPTPTPFYTSGATGTCVGCHFLSRDGVRISLAFDDPDADDEFGDVKSSVLDVASRTAVGGAMMSPGFQTWAPDHSRMVASTFKMGNNQSFAVFDSNGQKLLVSDAVGGMGSMTKATQPDLSSDQATLVYVVPSTNQMYGISNVGDHHFMGGSLYLSTFNAATNTMGAPSPLLLSTGTPPNATNFYYPGISPDGSFVVLNAAPSGDAFYNVNARVKLLHLPAQPNAQPIDLPALNVADGLSNSWPRWSPFVQTYKGHKLLWVTFSSNRDYGLHLQKNASFPNCYPPESPMYDQPQPLSKMGVGYENCAQPQIWMAGIIVDPDPSLDAKDRSFPAFWLPFQDVTAHNHSAQWVEKIVGGPAPDAGTDAGSCGESGAACGGSAPLCCSDMVCCNGLCLTSCAQ